MVKVPVKRKQKQKVALPKRLASKGQKQKVKVVSQNVQVIVGDTKRKREVKKSVAKSGANAKPPIVLNISNPQPVNNMFMEYFKKQLQNQQPIKGNTLRQNEILNEREENIASRAGTLHPLDQEPNDVDRELRRQAAETRARVAQAEAERNRQDQEMAKSVRKIPKETKQVNKRLVTQPTPMFESAYIVEEEQPSEQQSEMIEALNEQASELESAIDKGGKSESSSSEGVLITGPSVRISNIRRQYMSSSDSPTQTDVYDKPKRALLEKKTPQKRRGRKKLSEEVIQERIKEEKRLRRERAGMAAQDPKPRRGRKILSQEEIDKRRRERELEKLFKVYGDTDGDY